MQSNVKSRMQEWGIKAMLTEWGNAPMEAVTPKKSGVGVDKQLNISSQGAVGACKVLMGFLDI